MKLNRNSKIFINYFLGPLLFAWLSWSIYQQVRKQPNLENAWAGIKESFSGPLLWNGLAVIALMIVNWSIEAIKWKLSVSRIQPVTFFKSFRAVLSGVSFSVSTPNRVGEYFGRVLYMDEGNRLKTISVTIVGSISQLIITLLMGSIGLLVLQKGIVSAQLISPIWMKMILAGVITVFLGLVLFYFRLSWLVKWVERVPGFNRFTYLVSALEDFHTSILFKLLLLSILRFFVFIAQYYLVFPLFDVDISWWSAFWGVSVSFLVMAAIPTIALIELPLRGKTMTMILALFTTNQLGVGFSTAAIWLINLVVPAIVGSLLILGLRKLVKNEEKREDGGY